MLRIHRDLKPANILVAKQGIRLLDFGLAKQATGLGPEGVTRAALAIEGQLTGTLHYMSPEQVQGKEADAHSDIFSFGCMYFIGADQKMMAADVKGSANKFEAGIPKPLFDVHLGGQAQELDVGKDGRLLIPTAVERPGNPPLTVVLNWTAGLKK